MHGTCQQTVWLTIEVAQWMLSASKLVNWFVQGAEEDVEMADAPDEYLDPITYTIMQDPVKLPSGAVMDRPNVMRMLLTDPRDPTTRFAVNRLSLHW